MRCGMHLILMNCGMNMGLVSLFIRKSVLMWATISSYWKDTIQLMGF